MRKIPTLFLRDPADMSRVLPEVHPDCGWVLAGEGVATRKYDGVCVMLNSDGSWWARREVKPGKATPPRFVAIGTDEITGKTVGWEPIEASGFHRWFLEAHDTERAPGTYELIGPKINGNPERMEGHELVKHSEAARQPWYDDLPTNPAEAREFLRHELQDCPWFEGIVWHHPDGRMAKLKRRDFR